MDGNGVYLVSLVKYVAITINSSVLSTVFGLKFTNPAPPSLSRKMAKALCLTYYACPQKLAAYKCQNRTPPYHVLFPEPRLLHYVFVRIFYPKNHSKEAYNEVALESIYRLMNGYSVDYASIIVNYMYRVANMSRPSSLPYGNLLTRIFTHFKVPFESEDCVSPKQSQPAQEDENMPLSSPLLKPLISKLHSLTNLPYMPYERALRGLCRVAYLGGFDTH
ncbi:hypothetical protein Cgig2_023803 [Carnegiea gigantea]|uniref:Uncharacterized protein n=1 Tax=Carnegiea gigantea TaxID=171969 RepID=A0A9Q1GL98_9CARY|nr:hypothetical protein Cgig2_023803 [Carnegiea gigantea]